MGQIRVSHCGSLPRPEALIALLAARDAGEPHDGEQLAAAIADSVSNVVRRQAEIGVDLLDDGEHSKMSFTSYTGARLGGLAPTEAPAAARGPSRDSLQFAAVYDEQRAMYAARPSNERRRRVRDSLACTGPIEYIGHDLVKTDILNLQNAMKTVG